MIDAVSSASFWIAIAQIVWVDILLSGDNAVVIALAARKLSRERQRQAIVYGSIGAIVLRVVLIFFAVALLSLPYLKLVGALLLLWIGIQLLVGGDGKKSVAPADNLVAAVRTILVADLVMSVDNVLALAAIAETAPPSTRFFVLVLGLGLTIPLIMFGSRVLLKAMQRLPIIVTAGAALLGYVAGEMAASDPLLARFGMNEGWRPYALGALCAAVVVVVGLLLRKRAPG